MSPDTVTPNDLAEAIKNETAAEFYLSDTSAKKFIADVKDLIKQKADKYAIKEAIESLQKFL